MPSRTPSDAKRIDSERQGFRQRISKAIDEEDDPLALYDEFVHWTIKNYGKSDPNSGLIELLEQATDAFKDDPVYKTDLRYLKLWALYAAQLERPEAIALYASLLTNEIGRSFSMLYENYAALLEAEGRRKDAESIYRKGIKVQARPLERLKSRYADFQSRFTSTRSLPSDSSSTSSPANDPRHNAVKPTIGNQSRSTSTSSVSTQKRDQSMSLNSTRESRYAAMLAPPDPGKRLEKQRFDFSLLYTKEGGEYSIQEARARSMGLLGKKWGPPPASETIHFLSSSLSVPVNFNDDGSKQTFTSRGKSLMGGAEPTVTINTRAALDDVFGIYNSPDRTVSRSLPGSKHAPLKEVKLAPPASTPASKPPTAAFKPFVDENNYDSRTPSAKFMPFVDDNNHDTRTPSAKFTPFVDEGQGSLTNPRPVLSVKEPLVQIHTDENSSRGSKGLRSENVEVFTPAQTNMPTLAPLRDVFTDQHGKPQAKVRPAHERAKSHHDAMSPQPAEPARPFAPFLFDGDAKTPFKVFSRPSEQSENAFTPKTPSTAFAVLSDIKPTFTPFRDTSVAFTPAPQAFQEGSLSSQAPAELEEEGDMAGDGQYEDDETEGEPEPGQYEAPLADEGEAAYEEGESYQEIPLGGRFGRFNVMTPITERTFEYTTSTRGASTPSGNLRYAWSNNNTPGHKGQGIGEFVAETREEDEEEERLEPINLPPHPPELSQPTEYMEEKTAALSLGDSLTANSKFKPPNPCNPFDPSIVKALLSRIRSDTSFYDLRDKETNQLESLQKFVKKTRKTSGGSSTNVADISSYFSLELEGHRFSVSEKLGEGGFGAVFRARDIGLAREDEDSDEDLDDEDEDVVSWVALKIVRPRNIWEYHVLRRLHLALPEHLRRSVILPHALYAFRDESFLVLDYCSQGTLLNVVNNAVAAGVSQQGACLDELLVVFFTVELLRLVEVMHNVGFIHGDLKVDNCLLRLEDVPGGSSAWSSVYQPSGEEGWSSKGLRIIDFGRTIDTRLFAPDQTFIAEWPTDDRDCFEARENRPWTFQTDYFGLVGIIYCMLFGKYIQASSVMLASDRYKISTPLKRYWQTDLWNRLFDVLLNPCTVKAGGKLPVSEELGVIRGEMEAWLQANCNRTTNTLKGLLKKVEVSCYIH